MSAIFNSVGALPMITTLTLARSATIFFLFLVKKVTACLMVAR